MSNTYKLSNIVAVMNFSKELSEAKLKGKVKFKLAKLLLAIEAETKLFEETRNKIGTELGLTELEESYRSLSNDKETSPETLEALAKDILPLQEKFYKEVNDILSMEVELNTSVINQEELEEVELSIGCIITLDPFIVEAD